MIEGHIAGTLPQGAEGAERAGEAGVAAVQDTGKPGQGTPLHLIGRGGANWPSYPLHQGGYVPLYT